MTSNDIRGSFLTFFERHGHRIVPSSSLVPADDPSLLFTNAGMNQFKDVFLGKERRDYARATSSQKCMRVSGKHNDLENVGPSLRHHTFFEMLGNFSFGDYFKRDAVRFAWELLTDVWRIRPDRLYATVFSGEGGVPRDDEAYDVWRKYLPADRVGELGLSDNFWAMGETGPCGRCSEIHYFHGNEVPCPEPVCKGVACSCDRFVEIWNNVFMEFDRQADGRLNPLPARSIDTGMGLERMTAVLQNKLSNYDTDVFTSLITAIGQITGTTYKGSMSLPDVSTRVVADHMRAMTFLIADGVAPSNEWRGYVLRKIMRRAMRHGKRLGLQEPALHQLVDVLVKQMGDAYPELTSGRGYVVQVVRSEEERFETVLSSGLPRLEEVLDRAAASSSHVVPGEEAFRLYDTYGVPLDFIEDLASERHLALDGAGFDQAMEAQRQKARSKSTFESMRAESFSATQDATAEALRGSGDRFEGYTTTRIHGAQVIALFDEDRAEVPELPEGQSGYVALDQTPFYLEAGGQVSDAGRIYKLAGVGEAVVEGVLRASPDWPRLHRVHVVAGVLAERDLVTAEVHEDQRDATRRHHTATHLLHAALRQVLGGHVAQRGSLVAPDRLRFDFVHFAPLTREQIEAVERIVNEQICRNTPLETEIRSTQDAIAEGAMALFGEKYGDRVRVVSVPGFSMELCGGTHVQATGDIGFFTIVQEGGIAAGVRRIEAVTGVAAVAHCQERRREFDAVLAALNVPGAQAAEAIERLQGEAKRLARENSQLKMKVALGSGAQATAESDETVDIGPITLVRRRVEGLEKDALRGLADTLKARIKSGVVVLASAVEEKVAIVVSVTPDLAKKVQAGKIVKQIAPIVGGGGGGRPDFAEAGGRNVGKIDEMLAASEKVVREMIGQ
jgi:alanyl-tRNA synthetase